jgi:hypothetical protein
MRRREARASLSIATPRLSYLSAEKLGSTCTDGRPRSLLTQEICTAAMYSSRFFPPVESRVMLLVSISCMFWKGQSGEDRPSMALLQRDDASQGPCEPKPSLGRAAEGASRGGHMPKKNSTLQDANLEPASSPGGGDGVPVAGCPVPTVGLHPPQPSSRSSQIRSSE